MSVMEPRNFNLYLTYEHKNQIVKRDVDGLFKHTKYIFAL